MELEFQEPTTGNTIPLNLNGDPVTISVTVEGKDGELCEGFQLSTGRASWRIDIAFLNPLLTAGLVATPSGKSDKCY